MRWQLFVRATPALTSEGLLTVRLVRGRRELGATQLKVGSKSRPSIASAVEAKIYVDGDMLVGTHETQGFVTLNNLTDYALAVGVPSALPADKIDLDLSKISAGVIPPHGIWVGKFAIRSTRDKVPTTGKHVIGMKIPLSTKVSGTAAGPRVALGPSNWGGDIVLIKEIEVSVPAIGAIQTVLQIPSMLLMPGLLVIVTFFAIYGLATPPKVDQDPLSRLTVALSPWLWIGTITLSGAIGFTYARVSGHNILYEYDFVDLVYLWFSSIGLGGLLGSCGYGFVKYKQWQAAAPRFAPGIEPLDFLAQLIEDGQSSKLPGILIGQQYLFDLRQDGKTDPVWATSAVNYSANRGSNTAALKLALKSANQQAELNVLRAAQEAGTITIQWDRIDTNGLTIAGPRIVAASTFSPNANRQVTSIVQEAM